MQWTVLGRQQQTYRFHIKELRASVDQQGPVGEQPIEEPVDVAQLTTSSGARGHQVFPGRIDRSLLRFAEWAMVTALRVKDGDYRDWPAVRAWAGEIAAVLEAERAVRSGVAEGAAAHV